MDSRKLKGESSDEKRTAFEIFQFLLLMVFQGCNLYRYLGSKKQDIACSKSTYHRFLGNEHYNWRRFITLLAAKVTMYFDILTDRSRFKALVLDDSVIERNRSKAVELLYDQFSPFLLKCSMVNGHRDEDLYQTLLIEFLQVIQKFRV